MIQLPLILEIQSQLQRILGSLWVQRYQLIIKFDKCRHFHKRVIFHWLRKQQSYQSNLWWCHKSESGRQSTCILKLMVISDEVQRRSTFGYEHRWFNNTNMLPDNRSFKVSDTILKSKEQQSRLISTPFVTAALVQHQYKSPMLNWSSTSTTMAKHPNLLTKTADRSGS